MAAFTDEQVKILEAAFHHIWKRMEWLHKDINESWNLLMTLIDVLEHREVATEHEVTYHARTTLDANPFWIPLRLKPSSQQQIMRRILKGDRSAYQRIAESEVKRHQADEAELGHRLGYDPYRSPGEKIYEPPCVRAPQRTRKGKR